MDAERDKIIARIAARKVLLKLIEQMKGHGVPWTGSALEAEMSALVTKVGEEIADESYLRLPPVACPQCGVTFWEDEGCGCWPEWDDSKLVVLCSQRCKGDYAAAGAEDVARAEAADRDVSRQIRSAYDVGL